MIEIFPYDPTWPELFEEESIFIRQALGENCLAVHHFGSTAVPLLRSKPVVDILAEVETFLRMDVPKLEQLGFEFRGEVIISGRYFSKRSPRVHLHIFERENPLIRRNLDFRDWLRVHEDDREAYAVLKEQLASSHSDGISYARAKTAFVDGIIAKCRKQRKTNS